MTPKQHIHLHTLLQNDILPSYAVMDRVKMSASFYSHHDYIRPIHYDWIMSRVITTRGGYQSNPGYNVNNPEKDDTMYSVASGKDDDNTTTAQNDEGVEESQQVNPLHTLGDENHESPIGIKDSQEIGDIAYSNANDILSTFEERLQRIRSSIEDEMDLEMKAIKDKLIQRRRQQKQKLISKQNHEGDAMKTKFEHVSAIQSDDNKKSQAPVQGGESEMYVNRTNISLEESASVMEADKEGEAMSNNQSNLHNTGSSFDDEIEISKDTTPIVKPRKKRRRKKRTRQAAKSNSLVQKEAENENAPSSISLIQTFFEGFLPLAAVMALIAFVNYVFDHHLASYFISVK